MLYIQKEGNIMIYENIYKLIGNTPIVKVDFNDKDSGDVFLKLEWFNPGGSVKDRIAIGMIEAAEEDKLIKPGDTIVEPTSGNTGIGIAMVGAAKGYKVILTMPDSLSIERRQILKGYGAELILTEAAKGMKESIKVAEELVKEHGYFMPMQFKNLNNPRAHMKHTALEILKDLPNITHFVAAVGTGGTITGSGSVGITQAGAGSDGVTYEIAVALLGYTDSALIDEAIDAIAAQDSASLFTTIDRVIESGQDPKRFASDLLERMRDLIIVGASDENNSAILISLATDQLDRIRTQAKLIGIATLIRSADLIAQGLTQMRGATPPRLILELICGQMMLPTGDNVNITARIEKLEKSSSLITPTIQTTPAVTQSAPIKEAKPVKEVVDKVVESKPIENKPVQHKSSGSIDITSLRRMWPQVIDSVKGKRRLTWSLLATSAQILSLDDENITIGIVNSGAKDSFVRSESDLILSDAFEEVTGVRRKIVATVDSSVAVTTMTRADEDPGDKDMLSGADLLASKLGAKVIKESN